MTPVPGLCIVHPNPGAKCETFIRNHIQHLEPHPRVFYGGHMPLFAQEEVILMPDLPMEWRDLFSPHGEPENHLQEQAAQAMADLLVRKGIRVVLAEYGPTGVAMTEPCRRAGIPLVTHFLGCDASLSPVLDKYRKGYAKMFEYASALVVMSYEMADDLEMLGAPAEKIHRNPCGVDTELFAMKDRTKKPPLFIAVGRFVEKKSPVTTLLAFAEVAAKVPDARLVMIGDGPLRKTCIRLATTLHLNDRIEFPGILPPDQVAARFHEARCFVQHSVTSQAGDKEGMPVAILEAASSGLPVISTLHAGIPEAVEHGVTGLLCREHDMKSMAQDMLRLARDPGKASRMGRDGRARIQELYTRQMRIEILANLLNDAVAKGQESNHQVRNNSHRKSRLMESSS